MSINVFITKLCVVGKIKKLRENLSFLPETATVGHMYRVPVLEGLVFACALPKNQSFQNGHTIYVLFIRGVTPLVVCMDLIISYGIYSS